MEEYNMQDVCMQAWEQYINVRFSLKIRTKNSLLSINGRSAYQKITHYHKIIENWVSVQTDRHDIKAMIKLNIENAPRNIN